MLIQPMLVAIAIMSGLVGILLVAYFAIPKKRRAINRKRVLQKRLTFGDSWRSEGPIRRYLVTTDGGEVFVSEKTYKELAVGETYDVHALGELFDDWRLLPRVDHETACRALLEALCCVMASDCKIGRSEQRTIVKIIQGFEPPLRYSQESCFEIIG